MPSTGTYIHLPQDHRHTYVYRIVCIQRLYELFDNGQNVLVSPGKWEDPFENFILRSNRLSRRGWFGQRWTRHRASDAMWRIYSKDSRGIRVRSTASRLIDSLSRSLHTGSRGFIGRVQYLSEKKLLQFAKWALMPGKLDDAAEAARTLLVKRLAFRHEGEVRLLLYRGGFASDEKLTEYSVNPHKLIDQLMLDPRMDKEEAESLKEEIRRRTRFRMPIKRSLLYAPPTLLLDQATNGGHSTV